MTPVLADFLASGTILLASALLVITARNPVHAALWLVLAFFSASCLWLLAYAEFLAVALVLVYVGAVMVLFLFVVMMLDINFERLRQGMWRNLPVALAVGGLMALQMFLVLGTGEFGAGQVVAPPAPAPGYSNTRELGLLLYTDYVYPFELAAVVLLVAIVAAIALTLRPRKASRYQDPAVQLAATKATRLRVLKVPPAAAPAPAEAPPAGEAPR